MSASTPSLVIVLGVEAPLRVFSTAQTEAEEFRLEADLRTRSDAVRQLLERIFELAVEPAP